MDYFAEHTLPCHIERKKLKKVIAAVFKHHTVLFCLFGRLDKLPCFIKCTAQRDFTRNMFSVLHGIEGHRGVKDPWRAYIYKVKVR